MADLTNIQTRECCIREKIVWSEHSENVIQRLKIRKSGINVIDRPH